MGTLTCPACGAPQSPAARVCEHCLLDLKTPAGWSRPIYQNGPEPGRRTRAPDRRIVTFLLGAWVLVGAIGLLWADSLLSGSSSAWGVLIVMPIILGALAIWVVVLVVLVVSLIMAVATRHDVTLPRAR